MIGRRKLVYFLHSCFIAMKKNHLLGEEKLILFVILSLKVLVNRACKENLFFQFSMHKVETCFTITTGKFAKEGVKSERHSTTK